MVAWLKGQEPGASLTRSFLDRLWSREISLSMSILNVGEVYYSIAKGGREGDGERVLETMSRLGIRVVSAHDEQVMKAARLKSRYAIAYGDAFAAQLAIDRKIPLITGDKELLQLADAGVLAVEWVGDPVSR